ncbi:tpr domain containing protein [Stylonychia lemnae]|uniref:Tpr domain containing protein n=1 Tax=Stylonychia lemnae TaxID=5949 RepID=A0A078B3C6_STYLE|nr:tpr domain containing protein [Stylonychia lemnae]|eukprot:CDW89030.1 tpr domain containing protein [Stylonychia lemnae]
MGDKHQGKQKLTENSVDKIKKNVQELIRLESGDIKTCKDLKCDKKYPHQHLLTHGMVFKLLLILPIFLLIDHLTLYPKNKQIESFVDTLPQYLSEEEMNPSNIIQQLRFQKKKQQQHSIQQQDQVNDIVKKHQRKMEIVKQENFEDHKIPNRYAQNRMNSSLNELMSRTEIEGTVNKLKQVPKDFIINPVIGATYVLKNNRQKSNDYISRLDKQHQKQQQVSANNGQSTLQTRTLSSTNKSQEGKYRTKDLDQTMMHTVKQDSKNQTFMDLTKNYANFQGFDPKSASHSRRKRIGVYRLLSPRTKIQEARMKDFNNTIKTNSDQMMDFSSLLMSKLGSDSTKLNSEYKNDTTSSSKPNNSQLTDINARDFNKQIQTIQSKDANSGINSSLTKGFSTIQNSPRIASTVTPQNKNDQNENVTSRVKFYKKDTEIFLKDKLKSKIKNNFANRKDRHIFTYHIEQEEIEPANFDYDFCNLLMEQIQPDNKKTRQQVFQDAEFWLTKGFLMQRSEGTEVALDYYKHGIRVNPWNFPCVYNLACVYSHLNQNNNARKWFNLAIKIAPNEADSYFGSAISSFKLRDYKSALQTLQSKPEFSTPESEREYKSLERQLKLQEGKQLIKYVFSIMILPLQTDKKLIEDYLDNYLEIQNQYNTDICIDIPLSASLDNLNQRGRWSNMSLALETMKNLKFLQNIPLDELENLIPKTTLKQVRLGDLIFVEEKIVLVLNGRLILRVHEGPGLNHKIVGQFSQGSILGFKQGDKGISCDSNSWIICASKEAFILEIDEKIYTKMLAAQKKQETEIRLLVLQNVQLFKQLFPLTQKRIVYEYGYIKRFEKGEMILPHHPRSALNLNWVEYYKDFNQNKLQKEIEKNLNDSDLIAQPGKIISPSVYEGYMKALSRKKQNTELLTTIKRSTGFNNQIRKIMFKNISDGVMNILTANSARLSTNNDKQFNSLSSFGGKLKYYIEKRPIMIIMQGKCKVVNNFDSYDVATLKRGDIFGESDFLRNISYDFFGDIIADDDQVEVLVIENPDLIINFTEKKMLVDSFHNRLDGVKYMIQTRYKMSYHDMHRY